MTAINIDRFKLLVAESFTLNEVRTKSRVSYKRIKNLCLEFNIDTSHFTPGVGRSTRSKKLKEVKICAFCGKSFTVFSKRQFLKQRTCSVACANSLFRTGENHGNWKSYSDKPRKSHYYRRLCFFTYGKKCAICPEALAVDVHHLDGNHKNNSIDNIIPLCANHHRYMYMRAGRKLIIEKVNNFLKAL